MRLCIDTPLRIAFVLLIGSVLSAGAHVGGRVYPIPELTDEMLAEVQLDGFVDEWSHLIGEPAMTLLDFTLELGPRGSGSIDPSDIDFQVWLAWHDEPARLYVAFVAADDVYKNTHTWDVDWIDSFKDEMANNRNDAIIFGFDGDHSGGPGYDGSLVQNPEDRLVEVSGETQLYEAISRTPAGPILDDIRSRHWSGVFAWMALPPYAEAGGRVAGETPVIWSIELYITPFDHRGQELTSPEGSVASDLSAGQIIGFAMGVFDGDGELGRNSQLAPEALADADREVFDDIFDFHADYFLDGLLLPAGGTAVESVSWGRIKASLEME